MDAEDNPHHFPDPTKRFQVYALERGVDVRIELIDVIERTGVSLPIADTLGVVRDIEDAVVQLVQRLVGDQIEVTLDTLPIVEQLLSQHALAAQSAQDASPPVPTEGAQDDAWRGDREDLQQRVVELMERYAHAIVDRRALALRLVSEMAIFEAGA